MEQTRCACDAPACKSVSEACAGEWQQRPQHPFLTHKLAEVGQGVAVRTEEGSSTLFFQTFLKREGNVSVVVQFSGFGFLGNWDNI